MRPKLIIDGNAVYEIDEGCMRRKRMGQGMEDCLSKKDSQEPPASTGGPVEAAGGDDFGLPPGFAPSFDSWGDAGMDEDGNLPF